MISAHVLGIEPRRQRGRADEIAEHHRELPALGGVRGCLKGYGGRRLHRSFRRTQTCDRLEKALAMPEGHAEFFEVAFRQFTQNLGVDVILAKQGLVLAETEAAQPIPDVHDRSPIGCGRS